ncbi:galactokinase [Kitasatospora sp. NPDC101155]|uniref:galactokinase n=1 Tax=Kitasatospora sp. NPDC101155 TaxID=3364097 RepID=UPI00380305C2
MESACARGGPDGGRVRRRVVQQPGRRLDGGPPRWRARCAPCRRGFVLPIALPQATRAAVRRRSDGLLRLSSAQVDGPVVELRIDDLAPGRVEGWAKYPAGVAWALRQVGHTLGGADIPLSSDVPTGAGLSSSAALECVVAAELNDLETLALLPRELALLAQRAENEFVGVPCGAMDQLASVCCVEGHALLLDTRELAMRQIPFDPDGQGKRLLVIDTRTKHDLADGAYAELRAGCEHAAELLGLRALRDLSTADLGASLERLPAELRPLVRHVVTENARVQEAVALLDAGDLAALGPVLTAGRASLRDHYRVSCPETDLAVDTAVAAGAHGARMTGGGFGGSVIALVDAAVVDEVTIAVTAAFRLLGYPIPRTFLARPWGGARRLG